MNDSNDKRRARNMTFKDALVAQIWDLSDEEVAQEARHRGQDLGASETVVKGVLESATRAVKSKTPGTVVEMTSARATPPQMASRHRLMARNRLAASVEPPVGPVDSKDQASATGSGSGVDKDDVPKKP